MVEAIKEKEKKDLCLCSQRSLFISLSFKVKVGGIRFDQI